MRSLAERRFILSEVFQVGPVHDLFVPACRMSPIRSSLDHLIRENLDLLVKGDLHSLASSPVKVDSIFSF